MPRPTGMIAVLFTDVVGSTRLWQDSPDLMNTDLGLHDRLVRSAIEGSAGYVFTTAGDSFAAAFDSPKDAAAAAVRAQRDLASARWGVELGLEVRMAIHVGDVVERNGDYFGPTLNTAARLMSAAHGGQILVTHLAASFGLGFDTTDLGSHQFRDLVEPVGVSQLVVAGLRATFPAIASLETLPSFLPQRRSSFIGRDRELDQIGALLAESRLVTVVGAGGGGKTRLAIEVAAAASGDHQGGVYFCDLTSVDRPDQLFVAIANGIGLGISDGREAGGEVRRFLQSRRTLLLVDNCEHLLDPVAELVDGLLSDSPGLRVLATSREPLDIDGERTFRLPPLDPETAGLRLFVDRAIGVDNGFSLDGGNRAAVVELCRRLDGIPLAIELAAARIGAFAPSDLLERIDDQLGFLRSGRRRGRPDRHRSLDATIAWSHDLLSDDERAFFRRLAAFTGPFTIDVVPAVTGRVEHQAMDLLESLVARSLVATSWTEGGLRAFRLLEAVRSYAKRELISAGELAAAAERHAVAYETFASPAGTRVDNDAAWHHIRSARTQLADIWSAAAHEVDAGRPDRAVTILGGAGIAVVGTAYAAEMLERLVELQREHAPLMSSGSRARLAGYVALSLMVSGRVVESVSATDRALAEFEHVPVRDRASLLTAKVIVLGATAPVSAEALTTRIVEEAGGPDSPDGRELSRTFAAPLAGVLATLGRHRKAVETCQVGLLAEDTYQNDMTMAILLWAAHLGRIEPDTGVVQRAAAVPTNEGGWRLSPSIAASMWVSPDPTEIGARLGAITTSSLRGHIPFEEAEVLVAYARLRFLTGDHDAALALIDVIATRSPWQTFVMLETLRSIHGWTEQEHDANRIAEIMKRAQPDHLNHCRDHARDVLDAEVARWSRSA